jgi:hypothetical protein
VTLEKPEDEDLVGRDMMKEKNCWIKPSVTGRKGKIRRERKKSGRKNEPSGPKNLEILKRVCGLGLISV